MSDKKVKLLLSQKWLDTQDILTIFNICECDFSLNQLVRFLVKELDNSIPLYIDLLTSIDKTKEYYIEMECGERIFLNKGLLCDYVKVGEACCRSTGTGISIQVRKVIIDDCCYSIYSGESSNRTDKLEVLISENNQYFNFYMLSDDFKQYFKDTLDLEPYIDKKSDQPKLTTNQDDNYKYSEALKPYNDIILAFDSEYQRLSNDNIRIQSTNHIQPWLKENYKDLKNHDIRVLNNLIQTHYKLKK